MALIPKIILTALSANASSFYLQEITGNYSGTNVGGYGAPNISRDLVAGILIRLYHEGNEGLFLSYRPLNVSDFTLGTTAQLVRTTDFGVEGGLTDGVLHAEYFTLLAPVPVISVTPDGLRITSEEGFRSNETVVVVGSLSYRVDTLANNTPSVLYLLDPIPVTTASVETGYVGTTHILNVKHVESELAKNIGVFAGRCGCNDKAVMDLTKHLLKLLGAPVRYECGDLKGAHNIIITLTNELKGGCGC